MPLLTVNGSTDGYTWKTGAVYATAQSAGIAQQTTQDDSVVQISNELSGGTYYIYRGLLVFDTSSLPSGANITSATVTVKGYNKSDTDTYNVVLVSGSVLTNTFVDADYGALLAATTSFGILASTAWAATASNAIPLTTAGLAGITKAGTTRFAFRLSKDISVSSPSGINTIQFEGSNTAGYPTTTPPQLAITYVAGEGAGLIGVVGETLHYVGKSGAEYTIQGTPV